MQKVARLQAESGQSHSGMDLSPVWKGHLRLEQEKNSPCRTGNLMYNCPSSTGKGVL